jgi:hypothetical protein
MIAFVAIYGGLGGLIFDAVIPAIARQHIQNPTRPPHAKFHSGQTMLLEFCSADITIALLFALPLGLQLFARGRTRGSLLPLHVDGTRFSGTAWSDSEFVAINPTPFGIPVQKCVSLLASTVVLMAVLIAVV